MCCHMAYGLLPHLYILLLYVSWGLHLSSQHPLCLDILPRYWPFNILLNQETSSQYMKILFHIPVETFEGEYHVLKTKHKYFSWAARGVDSDKKRKARNPIFSLIEEPGFLFLFEWTWRQCFKQENHSSCVLFRLERIRKLSVTAREAEWKTYGFQLPVSALIP